jgi:hypothetical protein
VYDPLSNFGDDLAVVEIKDEHGSVEVVDNSRLLEFITNSISIIREGDCVRFKSVYLDMGKKKDEFGEACSVSEYFHPQFSLNCVLNKSELLREWTIENREDEERSGKLEEWSSDNKYSHSPQTLLTLKEEENLSLSFIEMFGVCRAKIIAYRNLWKLVSEEEKKHNTYGSSFNKHDALKYLSLIFTLPHQTFLPPISNTGHNQELALLTSKCSFSHQYASFILSFPSFLLPPSYRNALLVDPLFYESSRLLLYNYQIEISKLFVTTLDYSLKLIHGSKDHIRFDLFIYYNIAKENGNRFHY